MTVTRPDFDPEMTGHSAVLLDGTIHALVSKYDEDGRYDATECGSRIRRLQRHDHGRRKGMNGDLCQECWPETVLDLADSGEGSTE